ncbi:MAG: hypothetical protein EOP08_00905 [Proteobacteria bacterium]|nr:MAG: hypothetical protein EOP08_00905 [Pseudomonadota bacterium]
MPVPPRHFVNGALLYPQFPDGLETTSGATDHTEVVRVVVDPRVIPFELLLKTFWESHDPTQAMRQGNDEGTQYRSAIYAENETQLQAALASKDAGVACPVGLAV